MEGRKEIVREEGREKLPDNVVIVERPEARYRIVYERHVGERSPEEIGKPDALAAEFISAIGYASKFRAEELAKSYWEQKREEAGPDASREEDHFKSRRIPFYFIDITDPKRDILNKAKLTSVWLKAGEAGLAGGFAAAAAIEEIRKVKSGEKMSRREFLGFLGAGAGTAYFGTHLLDVLVKFALTRGKNPPKESGALRKIQRTVGTIEEKLHPETEAVLLTLRNALWAEKLASIAADLEKETGRRPEITFPVGAEHFGLEAMLATPSEKRTESIRKFLKIFGLKSAATELSVIARLEYSDAEKRWVAAKIFNAPELQKIEKELWPENTP